MTLSTTTSRVSYAGNASTTAFSVSFKFLADTDLVVLLQVANVDTVQVLNTDYTVTGAGDSGGGTVTFTSAPSALATVVIYRDPAMTQLTDYTEGDAFPVETIETALDRGMMVSQRLSDRMSRSPELVAGDTDGSGRYDFNGNRGINCDDPVDADDVANMQWVQGQILAAVIGDYGGVITPFMSTMLDDTTPNAALITLQFTPFMRDVRLAADFFEFATELGIITDLQNFLSASDLATAFSNIGITAFVQTLFDDTNAATARATLGAYPVPNQIGGCEITQNGTDPDADIDFAAGVASTQAGTAWLSASSGMTKRLDADWAAGSAQGGRASGTSLSPDTWYHCFIVDRSTGAVDFGFDTDVAATNLLTDTGGSSYHMVGSVLTDGSSDIVDFVQRGHWFFWSVPTKESDETVGNAQTLKVVKAPLGIRSQVRVRAYWDTNGAALGIIQSPDEEDVVPSITAAPLLSFYGTSINEGMSEHDVFTNTASEIAARASAAGVTLRTLVVGYEHPRGRW